MNPAVLDIETALFELLEAPKPPSGAKTVAELYEMHRAKGGHLTEDGVEYRLKKAVHAGEWARERFYCERTQRPAMYYWKVNNAKTPNPTKRESKKASQPHAQAGGRTRNGQRKSRAGVSALGK